MILKNSWISVRHKKVVLILILGPFNNFNRYHISLFKIVGQFIQSKVSYKEAPFEIKKVKSNQMDNIDWDNMF